MSDKTSPLEPTISPLLEADPASLDTLITERLDTIFNKPARLLTDEDLNFQIKYYRQKRLEFLAKEAEKDAPKIKPEPKSKVKTPSPAEAIAASKLPTKSFADIFKK